MFSCKPRLFSFWRCTVERTRKKREFPVVDGFDDLLFIRAVCFDVPPRRTAYFLLLLVGIVFGTLFRSLSSFMQMLIDPNEFQVVQNKMFASFNNVNTDILMLASVVITGVLMYAWRFRRYFDVLSLGRDQAVNLGIDYDRTVKKMLIIVAVLVSVSTALVGPITFLGLLVVNVAREFFKTYKHSILIPGAVLFSIIALVGGQFIVEKLFGLTSTLVVIIDFIGGIYFIYLLLKERK